MALYTLILTLGMILVWNAATSGAHPVPADVDYSDNLIETGDGRTSKLIGGRPAHKTNWKKMYHLFQMVEATKKLSKYRKEQAIQQTTEDVESITTANTSDMTTFQPSSIEAEEQSSTTSKPIYGMDTILEQLHDQTGEKRPIFHTALDGWIF